MFDDFFYLQVPKLLQEIFTDLPDEVTFSFLVEGEQGGEWQVSRKGMIINISNIDDTPKDCILRCQDSILQQIIEKSIDPRRAFFDGKLRLEGDVGLALQLQKTLAA